MTLNNDKTRRVAIQGVAGCWHDAAARAAFPGYDIQTLEYETFDDLFEAMDADKHLWAVVAIENTIAGALMDNHELLRQSNLRVAGEVRMHITHTLAALPGQTLDDITEVWSHPMALMQCARYLHAHPGMRKIQHPDTAGAALDISRGNIRNRAAICSALAAQIYGLHPLAQGIETNKRNFTRFLVLTHPDNIPGDHAIDKSSMVFTLPHEKGALSKVLTILTFYDMNLTKIQSTPIIGHEWEYRFYIDLTFTDTMRYRQAIDAIRPLLNEFKILGEYKEQ